MMEPRTVYVPRWALRLFRSAWNTGLAIVAILSLVALIRAGDALDQVARVQCGTHATIERILKGQDDPGARARQTAVYSSLGFSPAGITLIFREQEAGRSATLNILGPTPEGCTATVPDEPDRVEWPYPLPRP